MLEGLDLPAATHNYQGDPMKLSPLWAQEYIGADLAREFMAKTKAQMSDIHLAIGDSSFHAPSMFLKKDFLAVATWHDSDNHPEYIQQIQAPTDVQYSDDYHAVNVGNLVNGRWGVAYNTPFSSIFTFSHSNDGFVDFLTIFNQKREKIDIPVVLNFSQTWDIPYDDKGGMDQAVVSQAKKLASKSYVVTAAGNEYPYFDMSPILNQLKDPIVVSSLSPAGFKVHYSNERPTITVGAPVGNYILTESINKEPYHFSGTSAATPLVSGSIANLVKLLPLVSPQDVQKLIRMTATPTINSLENPNKNGHGMINTYRLVQVAALLQSKCGIEDVACVQKEIDAYIANSNQLTADLLASIDKNFQNFSLESVGQLFPSCALEPQEPRKSSCSKKKSSFHNLRRYALLNTENPDAWKMLKLYP
ncbi:MAG: S8 family serine peptidase [Bdellovibrionota bacterium]